jgi:hypothetical protein
VRFVSLRYITIILSNKFVSMHIYKTDTEFSRITIGSIKLRCFTYIIYKSTNCFVTENIIYNTCTVGDLDFHPPFLDYLIIEVLP